MRSGSYITVKEMGRRGGLARAKKLTVKQRSESARKAAKARWKKKSALSVKTYLSRKIKNSPAKKDMDGVVADAAAANGDDGTIIVNQSKDSLKKS
mgnify:FL=1